MAAVFLARERALGRLVALKVLLPGRAGDETARRRFEREARAVAALDHPNVVQIFRYGALPDGPPYLVMRYVNGRTLEERLAAEGRLSVALTRQVLRDVASALAAAHALGIVHRDVRPANVLLDDDSGSTLLTDFGIAALVRISTDPSTRLTRTGQMLGDPRYLSPEQLLDRDLTELADIYSVGVLGYELLTGEGPYEARTNAQWIEAHLSAEPRDVRATRPDVPAELADLLRRCLNREPNHRPRAADVARLLAAGPVQPAVERSPEAALELHEVLRRRVPQFVLVAIAAAVGFIQLVAALVEMETLPPIVWDLSLPFAAAGVAASAVVAWFHGERGKQDASVLEWVLLAVIGLGWLAASVWTLAAG